MIFCISLIDFKILYINLANSRFLNIFLLNLFILNLFCFINLVIFLTLESWVKSTLNTAEDEDMEDQLWDSKSHSLLLSPTLKSTVNQLQEWPQRFKSFGLMEPTKNLFGQKVKLIPKMATTKLLPF